MFAPLKFTFPPLRSNWHYRCVSVCNQFRREATTSLHTKITVIPGLPHVHLSLYMSSFWDIKCTSGRNFKSEIALFFNHRSCGKRNITIIQIYCGLLAEKKCSSQRLYMLGMTTTRLAQVTVAARAFCL